MMAPQSEGSTVSVATAELSRKALDALVPHAFHGEPCWGESQVGPLGNSVHTDDKPIVISFDGCVGSGGERKQR